MAAIRFLLCVIGLAAGALAAAPPNIILITLDTVRADRMGFLGSQRGLTPNLDALAREAAVFTRAYSQAPLTTASHATILTGTYPQFHKVNDFQVALAADLPYAPEILHGAGYHAAAFVGAMVLDPQERFARGFDRGFDTYDAGFKEWQPPLDRYHTRERRAGDVVARALTWLKQRPPGPFFLWVHLYDAHYPYDPPPPYKSKYAAVPYDGEIAYTDSAVGTLLGQLRALKLYDGAVIAVASDHGEALGDHGEDTHGIFLYDETIHVPLLIKVPGAAGKPARGQRIEAQVGLVDVLPTLLQTAGVAAPPGVQGESLVKMIKASSAESGAGASSDTLPDQPVYSETDYPQVAFGWSSLRALRAGKYLYIAAPRPELYEPATDPKAEHNFSSTSAAVAATLASQLEIFRQKTSSTREAPRQAVDPEAQSKLAALGYIAAGSNESITSRGRERIDPKDGIEIANQLHRTNFLIESQRFQEAIPILQKLIAKAPDMPLPYAQLGTCFLAARDFAQAVPVLRKLVELNPEPPLPHFQLAAALLATDQITAAVPELEAVVEKVPAWDQARLMLATAYFQTERSREAVTECEKILETIPSHYPALVLEGQILLLSKHPEAAISRLERAVAAAPDRPEPHTFLADAYTQLGQNADAERERAAARRQTAKRRR